MADHPSDAEIQSAMADILREGELSKLTSRIVRTQLEEKFGMSFLGRKKEIDAMLMEMIENQAEVTEDEKEQKNGTSEVNGVDPEESDQEDEQCKEDEPSAKKRKQESHDHMLNDAELARKLHEDEKGLRARKKNTKKTGDKKKSGTAKKNKESKREGGAGFKKLFALSPELSQLVGQDRMASNDIVKKMWEIIRERKLEDPKNKRFTICDEQLFKVFGRKRFLTFGMMKYLKEHMKDPALLE